MVVTYNSALLSPGAKSSVTRRENRLSNPSGLSCHSSVFKATWRPLCRSLPLPGGHGCPQGRLRSCSCNSSASEDHLRSTQGTRAAGETHQQAAAEQVQLEPCHAECTRDAEPACSPTASISRVVLAAQPGRIATRAFGARRSLSVPSTLLVFCLTAAAAVWTALQQRLQAVRSCKACKGYGIQRCKLCSGRGRISWEGKMAHEEPCPMCLGRRCTKCASCGGYLATKALFMQLGGEGAPDAALEEALASLNRSSGSKQGNAGGSSEGRRGGQRPLFEEIDALANEIMAD